MTSSGANSINISGGTFHGNAVGIGHVEHHGAAIEATTGLAQLREMLALNAAEIVALGRGADEQADLRHEVRKIEKELETDEPDGAVVRTRWKSVLAVLDGALAAGTKIAGITELVHKVFGG
jgi:hypothetical protein